MQIQINQEKKELKSHGSYAFPVMISPENLYAYERGSFFWHWHPEIELTLILEGTIDYQIGETLYVLHAGEGIFCNSNVLHTGKLHDANNCIYMSVTFHPRIIYGFESSLIQTKYVAPITDNVFLPSIAFYADVPWQQRVLEDLTALWEIYQTKTGHTELEIAQLLSHIWLLIYENNHAPAVSSAPVWRDRERLQKILAYIHEHYQEKITLDDISNAVNLCGSECCRFFKKHMNASIFDYIMRYRIEKSLPLLKNTKNSITDISLQTGFQNSSYFAKIFKQEVGCTPKEYRKQTKGVTPNI